MKQSPHIPVMCSEVLETLSIEPGDTVFDGTVGFGGHAKLILDQLNKTDTYIGCDQDEKALDFLEENFLDTYPQLQLVHHNFSEIDHIVTAYEFPKPNKVLLDLGFSSYHLDKSKRGFTHLKNQLLDMRMNLRGGLKAADILNNYTEKQLSDVFFYYGELYQNKKLVQNILKQRQGNPLKTTPELVELIKKSYHFNDKRSRFMRTCAQVFQALRVEVNDEIGHLETFLKEGIEVLEPGTKLAIITFQPLEDRTIRTFIRENEGYKKIHKKSLKPTQEEIGENSRSKSAKVWGLIRV